MKLYIYIDGAKALELLANRVKGHEDVVYTPFETAPSCRYEFEGCPSCLIGGALFDAGVPLEALAELDRVWVDDEDGQNGGTGITEVNLPEGVTLTPQALKIFDAAQRVQDFGLTWSKALKHAEAQAPNLGVER